MDAHSNPRNEAEKTRDEAAARSARPWKPGDPLLEGKVALIAGGGRGIGEATARMLAGAGAAVAVLDVVPERAERVATSLGDEGARAIPILADLRLRDDCQRAIESAISELGGLDVLANVAGGLFTPPPPGQDDAERSDSDLAEWHLAADCSPEEWNLNLHMNLGYVFWLCRGALPRMAERGGGSIVNVTSISGVFGAPRHAAYGAAKAGLIHLTKTLAVEYGRAGIRVNAVSPGSVATPATDMSTEAQAVLGRNTPLQRAGQPDDIARAVLYFASPLSDFVTGQMLLVDGGVGSKFPFAVSEDPSQAAQFG